MTETRKTILKTLITLSIPTVIEHIMSTLMQYVDTAMVGHLGEQATAAVSTTTTVNWLIGSVAFAVATASLALVSKANGERDTARMSRLTGQATLLTIIVGLALMIICLALAPFIPVWMGTEQAVRLPATRYFAILSLSLLPRTFMNTYGAVIRSTKNTRLPMIINISANLLNVVLNYILIYRCALGVTGAAIASSLAYTAGGLAMIIAVRCIAVLRFPLRAMRPDPVLIRQFTSIGIPAMGTSVTSCLGYVFFAGMVSGMGTTVFAAHSIAVTAEELFYIPGYGFRTATSALIGNALGERDERKLHITETLSIIITVSMMLISGVVLYFLAYPLMCLFTISTEVAQLGAQMLRLVAFTEPFFGLYIVLEGIFYGKGKTKGVFVIETASMWGIRILSTFICVKILHLDLRAVWFCMIADNLCKALALLLCYLRDRFSRESATINA